MTGAECRKIRERTGLTQAEFAALLGVHRITVTKWETETHPISEAMAHFIRMKTAPKGGKRRT